MKTLIYQCWDGSERPGNMAGIEAMKKYANKIGSDYKYEHNPKFRTDLGSYSPNYGKFKPIYEDEYLEYDYVAYIDCDVNPVDDLEESIFDQFIDTDYEVGICEEINAPLARKKYTIGGGINNANDEKWVEIVEKKWPVKMPRTKDGLPRVFNTGVIVYSNAGLRKAREKLFDFAKYVQLAQAFRLPAFYTCDQPYFHAMLEVCEFNWKIMPYAWNSSVHFDPGVKQHPRPVIDLRRNAKLVHIQINGADDWDANKIYRITNLPVKEWKL